MKEYIQVFLGIVLTLLIASMVYIGANKHRQYRQANICQKIGKMHGLKAVSVDNYHWSNASDCYLEYKGKLVQPWYIDCVNTNNYQ